MNFRQIEAFRAVMVTGSATAAARMLFITQPAVSRLIAEMEHRSNLKLFIRKPNRLEPTAEAQALYREVDRAFVGLEQIRLSADTIANKQRGSLRIAAVPVCVDSFLTPLISAFRKHCPDVSIELEPVPRYQALEMVRSQKQELGIVSLNGREDVGVPTQAFCRQQAVCVLPAGHPLCAKQSIHARDLENEAFISLLRGSPFRASIDEIFGRENIKRQVAVETRTQRTIYELVSQGAGVAVLDPFVVDRRNPNVVTRPFRPEIAWEFAVVRSPTSPLSLVAQSFVDLLMGQDFADGSWSAGQAGLNNAAIRAPV